MNKCKFDKKGFEKNGFHFEILIFTRNSGSDIVTFNNCNIQKVNEKKKTFYYMLYLEYAEIDESIYSLLTKVLENQYIFSFQSSQNKTKVLKLGT